MWAYDAQSDILLLGGDLYHDNKPSRQCMVKSMKLFKRYIFGDRYDLLSDARLARMLCDSRLTSASQPFFLCPSLPMPAC